MSALFVKLFSLLPLPLLRALGWLLGGLLSVVPNRERSTARVNLTLCFPELSERERGRLLRQVLRENTTTMLEMPAAWSRPADYWLKRCRIVDGGALMREKLALGKGVLVAAPHQGNWEVGVHALATTAPATILYKPPDDKALEKLIVEGRSRKGSTLVPIGPSAIRAMLSALKKGEMVTILPDQQPKRGKGAAEFAPFFGQPALTMTLLSRLARKSGAAVLLTWADRLPNGDFELHFREASPEVADADDAVATAALNRDIEAVVRTRPAQYLWTYRRFSIQAEGRPNPYNSGTCP